MKKTCVLLLAVLFSAICACSLPPERPVSRQELMRTRIYSRYIIDESPEQVLEALNREGEVIMEAKRNIRGRENEFPVFVKVLATASGLDVLEYDR